MEYPQRRGASKPQVKKKRVFTPADEEEPASQHYAGHSAGIHPEDTPHLTTGDARSHLPVRHTGVPQEPDDYEAGSFIATAALRYDGIPMPDGMMYRQGNDQIYVHKGPRPVIDRAHRNQAQKQLPPPRKTDEIPVLAKKQQRTHWLFFVGLGLLAMILGYVGINAFGSWWHTHNDDATYGRPRTFQIDAVVGHGDSQARPSHFIALNLNRRVVIIEIPGGDVSRSVIYSGGLLVGDGQDLTPITLSFSDVNGDGKVDMIVHILDQQTVFINNGTKFVPQGDYALGEVVPPSNFVTGGSNPPILGE